MRSSIILSLILLIADVQIASAARFLQAQVIVDGKLVLEMKFGAPDIEEKARTWARLGEKSFQPVGEIVPLADDPQKAVLTGQIHITIGHVDRPVASATTDRLQLVRDGGGWRLPPEELERTAQAAGLDPGKMQEPTLGYGIVILAACVAVVLVVIGGWVVRRRMHGSSE